RPRAAWKSDSNNGDEERHSSPKPKLRTSGSGRESSASPSKKIGSPTARESAS
ncbi:ATP-dependent RNA helicase, partial [Nostoc sp. 'Peltigera malacea cyanobiont' DB3992]